MLSSSLYSGDGRPPLNQRVFDSSRSPGSFTQHGHAQRGEVLSFALLSRPKDRTVLMHTANFSPRPSRNSLPLHRSYRLRRSFLAREEGRCLITITNYLVPFYSTSLTRKKIYLKKKRNKNRMRRWSHQCQNSILILQAHKSYPFRLLLNNNKMKTMKRKKIMMPKEIEKSKEIFKKCKECDVVFSRDWKRA